MAKKPGAKAQAIEAQTKAMTGAVKAQGKAQRKEMARQAKLSRKQAAKAAKKSERQGKKRAVKLTAQDFGFTTAVMKKYPGLKKVTDRAIREEWTPERYRAAVQDTDFWRKRSDSQRKFDIGMQSDPAQAQANIEKRYNDLKLMAQQMGVGIDEATLRSAARNAVRNDLDEDELQSLIGMRWKAPADLGDSVITGIAGQTVDAMAATAAAYGIPLSRGTTQEMVRKVLAGQTTVEGLEDVYREQAKRLYPGLADQLDKGFTVADVADPYLELAARELGVGKAEMDLTDPKWTKALTHRSAPGKPPEVMSMDEWQRTLRTDTNYGWDQTSGARQRGTSLGVALAQRMGAL